MDPELYFLKSIEEVKVEQKESHARVEILTKEFYRALKEHMDKEDERWIEIQKALESLRIADLSIAGKIRVHDSVFNKLWSIALPVIVSLISSASLVIYVK